MKAVRFICLLVVALFVACNNGGNKKQIVKEEKTSDTAFTEKKNRDEIINIEHLPDTTGRWLKDLEERGRLQDDNSLMPIDTALWSKFWIDFQEDIRSNNKKQIIELLEFPVHAIYPVLFQYAHDCDTVAYIENEKRYGDFDVDSSNINEYYDFIFTDVLKDVILQTSVDDLYRKGIRYKLSTGVSLTYQFFPKDYDVKVNCPNDHLLKFHISNELKGWQISIGGL